MDDKVETREPEKDLSKRLRSAIQSIINLDLDDPAVQDIDLDLDELHACLTDAEVFVRRAR